MNRWSKWIAAACMVALAVMAGAAAAADVDQAKLDKAFQAVQSWDYGQNAGDLQYLADVVVAAAKDPALRKTIEGRIVKALAAKGTKASKSFLCRQLVVIGTPRCVAPLAKLLTDKDLSHMARFALERIPGAAADDALRKALAAADDPLKVGMIYSLGRRGCSAAAADLIKLLDSKNEGVVCASLVALSRLDSARAVQAVARARGAASGKRKGVATNAYLDCAARLAGAGKTAEATAIYEELSRPTETWTCRVAALKGLAAAQPDKAVALAVAALADKDPHVRQVAIPTLRDVPGKAATKTIAAQLAKQDAPAQAMLLLVLVDRGDKSVLPDVVRAVGSPDEGVRIAALQALGKLGDASVVPTLVAKATGPAPKERETARASLDRMAGKDVNPAIAKHLASAGAKARAELVRCLGARNAVGQVADVLKAAQDKDPAVRGEAVKALRTLATADHVPVLLDFLIQITDAAQRAETARTVVAAAAKADDGEAPARAALAALARAENPAAKASVIRVLGKIAHKVALASLRSATQDKSANVQDAAIRALAAWPDAAPAPTLWKIAGDTSAKEAHRVIAFRGYVDQIPLHAEAADADILAMYEKAMKTAWRAQEKQLVLSRLARLRHPRALEIARQCLSDPALKAAAGAAVKSIEKLLTGPATVSASVNSAKAKNAIDGKAGTRWDTAKPMNGGEWFLVDLGHAQLISGILLDTSGSGGDYPRGYEVYVSPNMLGRGKLVAKGKGRRITQIKLSPPVVGRTIKIVQTGKAAGSFWSIHELKVQAKPIRK